MSVALFRLAGDRAAAVAVGESRAVSSAPPLPSSGSEGPGFESLRLPSASLQSYARGFPAPDAGFKFAPGDVRSKLALLNAAQALAENNAVESDVAGVRLDRNLAFVRQTRPRGEHRQFCDEVVSKMPVARRPHAASEDSGGVSQDFSRLRAIHPFVLQPAFYRRCDFCSGSHCSRLGR